MFFLLALLACAPETADTTETPTLPGEVFECPRVGMIEADAEAGWPMVAACNLGSCRPLTWALTETLIVVCTPGDEVVLTWR